MRPADSYPPGFQVFAGAGRLGSRCPKRFSGPIPAARQGRKIAARADGGRRIERSVPSPGPRRSFAGADHSRGLGDRQTGGSPAPQSGRRRRFSSIVRNLGANDNGDGIPTITDLVQGTGTSDHGGTHMRIARRPRSRGRAGIDGRHAVEEFRDVRRGALSERRRQVVADGCSRDDHAGGLTLDVLEASTDADALVTRPARSWIVDRRPPQS